MRLELFRDRKVQRTKSCHRCGLNNRLVVRTRNLNTDTIYICERGGGITPCIVITVVWIQPLPPTFVMWLACYFPRFLVVVLRLRLACSGAISFAHSC